MATGGPTVIFDVYEAKPACLITGGTVHPTVTLGYVADCEADDWRGASALTEDLNGTPVRTGARTTEGRFTLIFYVPTEAITLLVSGPDEATARDLAQTVTVLEEGLTTVPHVGNLMLDEAERMFEDAGLRADITHRESDHSAGRVIDVAAAQGSVIREGQEIGITVAS